MFQDTYFINSLLTDKYFIMFAIAAIMVPILLSYLNNSGKQEEYKTPFFNKSAIMAMIGFLLFGLSISVSEISNLGYKVVSQSVCSSKNYDTREIVELFNNRDHSTIRMVELRSLRSEFDKCKKENRISKDLENALCEKAVSTSSI